jgi:hypothetical protein
MHRLYLRSIGSQGVLALMSLLSLTVACKQARAEFVVTEATLKGPATIEKGKKATYTWTLKGSGAGGLLGTTLNWAAYDEDSGSDDTLVDETTFNVTDDKDGNFAMSGTFELECLEDCHIKGKDGQTDDPAPPDAQVFVLFEFVGGSNAAKTNILDVTCTAPPDDPGLPEPSALTLLGIGALSLIGYRRRQKRAALAANR